LSGFDVDRVRFDPEARGVQGEAGLQVEFPLMPGAFENFAFSLEREFADFRSRDVRAKSPSTERSTFVRADVADGVVAAVDIEDANPPVSADTEDLAAPRGNLFGVAKHATTSDDHQRSMVLDRVRDRHSAERAHRLRFRYRAWAFSEKIFRRSVGASPVRTVVGSSQSQ